jgi:hypothetical protein
LPTTVSLARARLVQRLDPVDVGLGQFDRGQLAVFHHLDRRRAVEVLEVEDLAEAEPQRTRKLARRAAQASRRRAPVGTRMLKDGLQCSGMWGPG